MAMAAAALSVSVAPRALSSGDIRTARVVVVGNGPAGLAASGLLGGHWPFYVNRHPDAAFDAAVRSQQQAVAAATGRAAADVSLLELNLAELAAIPLARQGRSNNPIALLVDSLLHPNADGQHGSSFPQDLTCLETRHLPERAVEHVVVGSGPAGGSWAKMAPSTQTLSPGFWMGLPGLPLTAGGKEMGRVSRQMVAEYYAKYSDRFVGAGRTVGGRVTALSRQEGGHGWRLTINMNGSGSGDQHEEQGGVEEEEVLLHATDAVLLATGMYDRPRRLETTALAEVGKDNSGVASPVRVGYRCPHDWKAAKGRPHRVLVVGAGLSASDCIVSAISNGWHVSHVFRTTAAETKLGSKFGRPSGMYAEYYHLTQLMHGEKRSELYSPFPRSTLMGVHSESGACTVRDDASGKEGVVAPVDRVVALVGSTPDLAFVRGGGGGGSAGQDGAAYGACALAAAAAAARGGDGEASMLLGTGQRPLVAGAPLAASEAPSGGKKATHPVYVAVDPYTLEARGALAGEGGGGLFAAGPLRGDNFVRFVLGDAWPLVQRLHGLAS